LFWINETKLVTSSADNTVKIWSLDSDTAEKTFTQGFDKPLPVRQVLGLFPSLTDTLVGSCLGGDVKHWSLAGETVPTSVSHRHKENINAIATLGDHVWFSSENNVFIFDHTKDLNEIQ